MGMDQPLHLRKWTFQLRAQLRHQKRILRNRRRMHQMMPVQTNGMLTVEMRAIYHTLCVALHRLGRSMRLPLPRYTDHRLTVDEAHHMASHTWNFSVAALFSSGVAF